ncbi:MAG: branched-chain amino acid ABC transporter permease [Rhodospirillaceae bacterium]|jgi:branched-chain amino acid transport system permease protein|nr:branched-chain amino acid ABC transporter permease [Rhodospirillaceae bacterium]MBT4487740.1 branched-chain amino acid ABC transporter permease [Rhodospirillaceae bacterium]MBT5191022.1 branched-chain amino acid ABC transporter permease [Rhodospirillaceae bacterium]MBT5894495.1 branched-chain amino acid ABC transporter permease [Rhodospirillaceae bacterium]MBT6426458.1 branched-chain amino acid ABC transporter permease [Rhodospirillaceae bacterium]
MDRRQIWLSLATLALFAVVPPLTVIFDQPFYMDMVARIMVFAIAAVSLDLILGHGGMVSFGHAVYMGIGAYAVGILSYYGIDNGFLQIPLALAASALIGLIFGAMSLRTSGVYFIMITLAFAQMLYFLAISLEEFGGDDGMSSMRSEFAGLIDLNDAMHFYYLVFAVLAGVLFCLHRLVLSRFGMVIRASRTNERRMQAMGFPTYRYKLAAFTIAGTICGLAGALFANLNEFVSPDVMHWTHSGEIMIMVIMGGMGTLIGPVLGATAFLLLEEYLPQWMEMAMTDAGEHWAIIMGPILIAIVLFGRGGIHALLAASLGRNGNNGSKRDD